MKKMMLILCFSFVLASCANTNEAVPDAQDSGTEVETEAITLEGEVGTVTEQGDRFFERVPDGSLPEPDLEESALGTSTFPILSFTGNTDINTDFILNEGFEYYKVWIENTGESKIVFIISGPSGHAPIEVPAHSTWTVSSDKKQPIGVYNFNFTGENGMHGEAMGRISSLADEL